MMRYILTVDVETDSEIDSTAINDMIVDALYQLPRGFWFTVAEVTTEQIE